MALNDLYIVTLEGGLAGLEIRQDFAYKVTVQAVASTAAQVRDEFMTDVLPDIKACVSSATPFFGVQTRNLFTPTDFEDYTISPAQNGSRAGNTMVTFVAVPFRSQKPAIGQNPARKRFGYLSETDVAGTDVIDTAGYFTALGNLANQLGLVMVTAAGNTFSPVVVRRIPYTTPSGKTAYRYPANAGEAVTYPAINWSYETVVTSQITRKLGRGI